MEEWEAYVYEVAAIMGLGSWEFNVTEADLDDSLASITVSFAREHATIALGPGFFATDADEKRTTIVHELLHAHHAPVDELIEQSLPHVLAGPGLAIFNEAWTLLVERMTDSLASAIALSEGIPLPPEGDFAVVTESIPPTPNN